MSGYNYVLMLRRFEESLSKYGFRMGHRRHQSWSPSENKIDIIALYPAEDQLPLYNSDTELFIGSIEEATVWMEGIAWARNYDSMIKLSTDAGRKRKEQNERNRQLMRKLADEKKE